MCRILAIKNYNYSKHKGILENFFSLAVTGKTLAGDDPGHCDGWGIGWYGGKKAKIYKSGRSIIKDKTSFFNAVKEISRSKILIAHLRKSAWKNTASKANAHPFCCGNILFAHNGTVRDYEKLITFIPENLKPGKDALDSEVLLSFISGLAKHGLRKAIKKSAAHIHKNNSYSALNCVLSDGKTLFAYRDFVKNSEYYTLYLAKHTGSAIIASEPLSESMQWRILKKNELFVQ